MLLHIRNDKVHNAAGVIRRGLNDSIAVNNQPQKGLGESLDSFIACRRI